VSYILVVETVKIKIIVFSKDRALQLDATLRSFFSHCQDGREDVSVHVIYKNSNELHAHQYKELSRLHPQVQFVQQKDFRWDLIQILAPSQINLVERIFHKLLAAIGSIGSSKNSRLEKVTRRFLDGPKIYALKLLLPKNKEFVLFLVDDNIFVRNFFLADVVDHLIKTPKAIGFSLRLGKNTNYCYAMHRQQALPGFEPLSQSILAYDWTTAELDFAYPLEVSSSVYIANMLTPLLMSIQFRNPNELEAKISSRRFVFKKRYPKLLCFDQSVTFCNPVNVVQNIYNNRAGENVGLSAGYLAELFAQGKQVSIDRFNGFIPNACHQEIELSFEDRNR